MLSSIRIHKSNKFFIYFLLLYSNKSSGRCLSLHPRPFLIFCMHRNMKKTISERRLVDCPTEIIGEIYGFIGTSKDVFNLQLTCTYICECLKSSCYTRVMCTFRTRKSIIDKKLMYVTDLSIYCVRTILKKKLWNDFSNLIKLDVHCCSQFTGNKMELLKLTKLSVSQCHKFAGNKMELANLRNFEVWMCDLFMGNNMKLQNLIKFKVLFCDKFLGNGLTAPNLKEFSVKVRGGKCIKIPCPPPQTLIWNYQTDNDGFKVRCVSTEND